MQLANAPGKIVLAFAADGSKNSIPVPSQIPVTPGAASWTDGFPPLTMVDPTEGGVGPSGLDFNGIYNAISALSLWYNAGAGFPFDSTFAGNVGGYPIGARVLRASGGGYWTSTIDNNSNNPDTGGAGWMLEGGRPSASVYASAQQTLAVGANGTKVLFDSVEFDSTGLWDATDKRFVANIAGNFRVSGAVLLAAPAGQTFASFIFKNGTLAKSVAQYPQVYDGNMSYPYDAIVNLAVGDFVELFLLVPQTAVLAGSNASNQTSVYAQIEYIGG